MRKLIIIFICLITMNISIMAQNGEWVSKSAEFVRIQESHDIRYMEILKEPLYLNINDERIIFRYKDNITTLVADSSSLSRKYYLSCDAGIFGYKKIYFDVSYEIFDEDLIIMTIEEDYHSYPYRFKHKIKLMKINSKDLPL